MQLMIDLYSQIVECKKKRMELVFAPVNARPKDFVSQIRAVNRSISDLRRRLSLLKNKMEGIC